MIIVPSVPAERLATLQVCKSPTDHCLHSCVFGEEDQEIVKHGYRRNVKEHVVEVVKLDERIKTHSDMVDFSSGCCGAYQTPHLCSSIMSTLQRIGTDVHVQVRSWKFVDYDKIISKPA